MSHKGTRKGRTHKLLIVLGILAVAAATVLYGAGSLRVSEEETASSDPDRDLRMKGSSEDAVSVQG